MTETYYDNVYSAVLFGDFDTAKSMLAEKPVRFTRETEHILREAVCHKNLEFLQWCQQTQIIDFASLSSNCELLYEAAHYRDLGIVQWLSQAHPKFFAELHGVLSVAAELGNLEMARWVLLESGADLTLDDVHEAAELADEDGHEACAEFLQSCEALLEAGAATGELKQLYQPTSKRSRKV